MSSEGSAPVAQPAGVSFVKLRPGPQPTSRTRSPFLTLGAAWPASGWIAGLEHESRVALADGSLGRGLGGEGFGGRGATGANDAAFDED
jgi:hypothetical protein